MFQINGQDVDTLAGYADSIDKSAQTVYQWAKKYVAKGGELTVVETRYNMNFYLVSDLQVMRSAVERTSKPKPVPFEDYMRLEAELENVKRDYYASEVDRIKALEEIEELRMLNAQLAERAAKAEAYTDSIIEG